MPVEVYFCVEPACQCLLEASLIMIKILVKFIGTKFWLVTTLTCTVGVKHVFMFLYWMILYFTNNIMMF